MQRVALLLALAGGLGSTGPPARSTPLASGGAPARDVYLTKEEALALAFPKCEIERTTHVLTKEQREHAEELAGEELAGAVVHAYVGRRDGEPVGTAWFDVHVVRSKKESLMVVVGRDHRIARLELLAFAEPTEYVPRPSWYAQFLGRELDDELRLKRGIKGVTGATLTARATTAAVRRLLAVHETLFPRPKPEPPPEEEAGEDEQGDDGGRGRG